MPTVWIMAQHPDRTVRVVVTGRGARGAATTWCAVAALMLGGCAASYTEPTLPADHPANAAAEESPPAARSTVLDLAGADPVGEAPAGPAMDHGGHGAPGAAPAAGAASLYSCPMHPEVTSDKPGQRCPKCGMRLERQEGATEP